MSKIKYRIRAEWRRCLIDYSDPYWYFVERRVGWKWFGFWYPISDHSDEEDARVWLGKYLQRPKRQPNKIVAEIEDNA